jgi:hypothetical protein
VRPPDEWIARLLALDARIVAGTATDAERMEYASLGAQHGPDGLVSSFTTVSITPQELLALARACQASGIEVSWRPAGMSLH